MWYVLPQSTKQYPLTIERVRKIRSLNMQNVIPEELEAVEVISTKPKEVEPEFVDVVGQISLRSLEKADKKRRDKGREQRQGNRPQQAGNRQITGPVQKQAPQAPQKNGGQQQRPVIQKPEGNRPAQKPQALQPRPQGQQQKPAPQQRDGKPQQQQRQGPPRPQGNQQRPPKPQGQGGQQRKEQGGGNTEQSKPE